TTRCALVPPKPKPLMPARRGYGAAFGAHGCACVAMVNGDASRPRPGSAAVKLCCGGTVRAAKARSTLISEATPDTQPVWPISDLTLPSCTFGSAGERAA